MEKNRRLTILLSLINDISAKQSKSLKYNSLIISFIWWRNCIMKNIIDIIILKQELEKGGMQSLESQYLIGIVLY